MTVVFLDPGVVDPVSTVNGHACRWCGVHDCPSRHGHERWWAGTDTYARLDRAAKLACPACGEPVNDGRVCVSAPVLAGGRS